MDKSNWDPFESDRVEGNGKDRHGSDLGARWLRGEVTQVHSPGAPRPEPDWKAPWQHYETSPPADMNRRLSATLPALDTPAWRRAQTQRPVRTSLRGPSWLLLALGALWMGAALMVGVGDAAAVATLGFAAIAAWCLRIAVCDPGRKGDLAAVGAIVSGLLCLSLLLVSVTRSRSLTQLRESAPPATQSVPREGD